MTEALQPEESRDLTANVAVDGVLRLVTERIDTVLYDRYSRILEDILAIPEDITDHERQLRLNRIARLPGHGGQSY